MITIDYKEFVIKIIEDDTFTKNSYKLDNFDTLVSINNLIKATKEYFNKYEINGNVSIDEDDYLGKNRAEF